MTEQPACDHPVDGHTEHGPWCQARQHEEDITVPLVIYIGDERRIVGNAVVTGEEVRCFVHESRRGDFLGDIMDWIRREEVNGLSVTINPPPATPLVIDGHVKWVKNYQKGPLNNGR